MLQDLLDEDLKDELGIKSKIHRKTIINGIKELVQK